MTDTFASAPPARVAMGITPIATTRNLRIVCALTGEAIEHVIEADADVGTVQRAKVEDGNLVREGDSYAVINEVRPIRIEWIDPPVEDHPAINDDTDATPTPTAVDGTPSDIVGGDD